MPKPDFVFDDYAIQEYWFDFLDESGLAPGDEIVVKTATHEWKSRMEVIEPPSGHYTGRDVYFETAGGTKMFITITEIHRLEGFVPGVRTADGYDSRGELERVEVFK